MDRVSRGNSVRVRPLNSIVRAQTGNGVTRTRRKLSEAQFFLDCLKGAVNEYPEFDYYLSAFVGSSRSVLWVMRAEYTATPGWVEWFAEKSTGPGEDALFAAINEARLRSTKRGEMASDFVAVVDIPPSSPAIASLRAGTFPERFKVIVYPEGGDEDAVGEETRILAKGILRGVHARFREFPDDDVTEVCQRYVTSLETVVQECEEMFAL